MKLAFCLFKYYPFGGLERDFLRIAQTCQQRGHTIDVYVMQWQGEIPKNFNVHILSVFAFTNHQRCLKFAKQLQKHLKKNNYDVVIGFNRMPGLDVYFAADACYQTNALRQHGAWYRFTPRYRAYIELEKAVFLPEKNTHILLLTQAEKSNFMNYYHTPAKRFHEVPPGVALDRKPPVNTHQIREKIRADLDIQAKQNLILMVGSDFKRKGVDRALLAFAALPQDLLQNTNLIILGKGNAKPFIKLAKCLNIDQKIKFLGAKKDVLNFLLAADFLLHPAYQETAGMVLLEALVAGLPVLVTGNCGYAFHIEKAQAGLVVSMPYQQTELNNKLQQMLTSGKKTMWHDNAANYVENNNLFALSDSVADFIETLFKKK